MADFSVTAIVAIRNGAFYFDALASHMRENGVSLAVIDNESEDNLQELISKNRDIIVESTSLSYEGFFDLTKQLETKEKLVETLNSNWVIHLDVDELMYSDVENERLRDAIERVDGLGYNAINFDEFVFLPISNFRNYSSKNFTEMKWYYFFEPKPNRLIRAFHRKLRTDVESGGHGIKGLVMLYPDNMILKHYMFENKKHATEKYRRRRYSEQDLNHKFHGNRITLQNRKVFLPKKKLLKYADSGVWSLDTSKPHIKHFWDWG